MKQFEEQRNNQHLNQQNNKMTLKRSVSPICKLIILNNLDSYTKIQKSMRAKDDTLIVDVILYLESQHENKCTVTLYHNNNPINIDKNTYLLPFLQKLKIQQLDYKTQDQNRVQLGEIGIEDDGPDGPELGQKILVNDSSGWGNKFSIMKQNNLQGESNETTNTDGKASQSNSSTQLSANMEEEQRNRSDNDSEITILSIQCGCKKSYNSKELRMILIDAMNKKYIAKCQKCQQKIPRSMYFQIKVLGKNYHYLKQSLELEILKKELIQKMLIQKCQFCNFFCIWDKRKQSIQRFCPNCLQNCMISNNY